jgi:hypothetical protein
VPSKPPAADQDDVEAIVTLSDDHVHRIGAIAESLAKKGLKISHVLESSGIISGTAKASTFEDLRKTKGVAALEISGEVSVPSPGSEIQ